MPSIAIVGAGPQLGLAIARTFGSQGFDVALISRNRTKLYGLVGRLTAEGVTAAAFPADVLDHGTLTQALESAATHFGGIDVLEYSPAESPGSTVVTTPAETDPSHVQHELDFQFYGASTATRSVLPAMRETGAGTLLYTTDARSTGPVPKAANVSTAAAALRNWAVNLHKELAGTGVQAAHVALDVTIGTSTFYGQPKATADQLSPLYWELHTTDRDKAERIFRG
ncbi:SDR family NAD(P)-dependent oxidoreductase [Streptomyces acidicola]|uniref:SDR family NAD(P)-dependent oxidoreductase n=1 Tax=Streptomyces acidicola TaxID=2596892 RepID=A0A5N8WQL1_9ACTN|nr:SDR family NAD(P)-dependent oxidoreductase [Streptomyces acidicola]MPY48834.1 SDR family NAD(P)-dependent oxidoreductase [Streptomyces acidicola]